MSTPPAEIAKLLQFIAEKSKYVESPMTVKGLSRQFKEETGSELSFSGLRSIIIKHRVKIHEMDEFDNETKVKMMFATSAPVDVGFLTELRKQAEVVVDEEGRIAGYNDGSLLLVGDHSFPAKLRSGLASKRRRSEELEEYGERKIFVDHDKISNSRNFEVKYNENDDYEYDQANSSESDLVEQKPSIENVLKVEQEEREEELVGDRHEAMKTNRIPVDRSINIRDMLLAIRGPLAAIPSPLIQNLLTNIEQKISESATKQYGSQEVSIPFNACLHVLTENAVAQCSPGEDSTSLRDFSICLRAGSSFIRHPSMNSFHQELDDQIKGLTIQDKRIPVEIVHRAVAEALVLIAP